jgi:hypothetical protein
MRTVRVPVVKLPDPGVKTGTATVSRTNATFSVSLASYPLAVATARRFWDLARLKGAA